MLSAIGDELLHKLGYRNDLILSGEHDKFGNLGRFYGTAEVNKFTYRESSHGILQDDRTVLEYLDKLPAFDEIPRFMFFFLMSTHVNGKRIGDFEQFPLSELAEIKRWWNNNNLSEVLPNHANPDRFLARIAQNYEIGILQADWVIGQIFTILREKGYLKDAMVIITSDHGDALGEHNHLGHSYRLYNEDIRIPLVIWDSNRELRLKNTRFFSHVDLAPTIFSRLGLQIPNTWSGVSLLESRKTFTSVHVTQREGEPCAAAISGTSRTLFKLIICKTKDRISEEFYDLERDPHEDQNRIDEIQRSATGLGLLANLRRELQFFTAP